MPPTPTPEWQPLSRLPLIARLIDDYLADAVSQKQTLLAVRERPQVFDDALVDRLERFYGELADELLPLFEEQLRRWTQTRLTLDQDGEITRLRRQTERLRPLIAEILGLTADIRGGTINRVLEKSDLELGLETLLGNWPPPR